MSNYSKFEADNPATWAQWEFLHPAFKRPARGKLFLGDKLGLTGMEVSLNSFPKGASMPFHHTHRDHEELYLFISGRGQFQVDGEIFEVESGSAVRVATAGKRCWRNTGEEPLVYIVIQAKENSIGCSAIADGQSVAEPVTW